MGILECASGESAWRGYDYYKNKKVVCLTEIDANRFSARVSGNSRAPYSVELDMNHPRKCKCSCPHANGRRIICKHMVAVYFTVHPEAAEQFYTEAMAYQEEAEARAEALYDKVCKYVSHMKKSELEEALLRVLFDGPEWQFDHFVRDNGLEDDW